MNDRGTTMKKNQSRRGAIRSKPLSKNQARRRFQAALRNTRPSFVLPSGFAGDPQPITSIALRHEVKAECVVRLPELLITRLGEEAAGCLIERLQAKPFEITLQVDSHVFNLHLPVVVERIAGEVPGEEGVADPDAAPTAGPFPQPDQPGEQHE